MRRASGTSSGTVPPRSSHAFVPPPPVVDRLVPRPDDRATEDIARRVDTIQQDTEGAVAAIGRISEVIGYINDYQLTIASAVEEQTATTNEMSRSVGEAADGSGQIATNIGGVSGAADATNQALGQTRMAVDELARMASELRSAVSRFSY